MELGLPEGVAEVREEAEAKAEWEATALEPGPVGSASVLIVAQGLPIN